MRCFGDKRASIAVTVAMTEIAARIGVISTRASFGRRVALRQRRQASAPVASVTRVHSAVAATRLTA